MQREGHGHDRCVESPPAQGRVRRSPVGTAAGSVSMKAVDTKLIGPPVPMIAEKDLRDPGALTGTVALSTGRDDWSRPSPKSV
jgi:hypothetical protein